MARFSISPLISNIGESVQVVNIGSPSVNTRGDLSGATYTYANETAIVQLLDAGSDEVKEGVMQPADLEAWFDISTSISGSLVIGNIISGAFFGSVSRSYEVKEVLQELDHFKVLASKL